MDKFDDNIDSLGLLPPTDASNEGVMSSIGVIPKRPSTKADSFYGEEVLGVEREILEPILKRLSKIVQSKFAAQIKLTYKAPSKTTSIVRVKNNLIWRNIFDLYFPIQRVNSLSAWLEVTSEKEIKLSEISQLVQLIDLVLEPTFAFMHRLGSIQNLENVLSAPAQEKNVIRLGDFRNLVSKRNVLQLDNLLNPQKVLKSPRFCFVEAANSEDVFKIALKIHDASRRYAFVSYKDLTQNEIPFKDLGPVTILIANMELLTDRQQLEILEYISANYKGERPLFLFGSSYPLLELQERFGLRSDFLDPMGDSRILLQKPLEFYSSEQINKIISGFFL